MNSLTMRDGETEKQFIRRIVDGAPHLTPEKAARLAALLPLPTPPHEERPETDRGCSP